jgi:hypothetical protein
MVATTQILKKLQLLQELIGAAEAGDEVLDVTISKLLGYELEKLRGRQTQMGEKLTAFEARYDLKTEEFVRKFRDGTLGDAMDFFEWAALADMYHECSQRLAEAERVCHECSGSVTPQ